MGSIGYPTEVHEVETEDGYVLDVYRVPYGIKSVTKTPNPVRTVTLSTQNQAFKTLIAVPCLTKSWSNGFS